MERIVNAVKAGCPAIHVRTPEIIRTHKNLASALKEAGFKVFHYNAPLQTLEGFVEEENIFMEFKKLSIMNFFNELSQSKNTVFFISGLHEALKKPEIESMFLSFVREELPLVSVIIVYPHLSFSSGIERYFVSFDFPFPTKEEREELLRDFIETNELSLEKENFDKVVEAGKGLTEFEFLNALSLSVVETGTVDVFNIYKMKEQLVEKNASLQLFHPENLDEVQGLDKARSFIKKVIFSKMGQGVLLVGVPGTGKSLLAKSVGREMNLPTIILNFESVFGSLVGESERKLREALAVIDAMSPCIVFIDEIEKGLSGLGSSDKTDGGTSARVFGHFLKWLNDRKSESYVIATANDISMLPAEFKRAGRWDAMFFVDIPNEKEVENLISYYIEKYEISEKPASADFIGYTGAEIKQICKTARMLEVSLQEAKTYVKPIAEIEKERIETLRQWAKVNCVPASSYAGKKRKGRKITK